jgi:hypothetical protein
VHTGGSIDDEHGGWARLFRGVSESLVRDREEHRAAQNVIEGFSERYRRLFAQEDRTTYIHLSVARVLAPGVSPLPPGGMHWRGRLSDAPQATQTMSDRAVRACCLSDELRRAGRGDRGRAGGRGVGGTDVQPAQVTIRSREPVRGR